jgi:hypothetical protein
VEWGEAEAYWSFEKDMDEIVALVARRTATVARAVSLSIVALVAAVLCFALVEFASAPHPPCGPPCRMEAAVAAFGS